MCVNLKRGGRQRKTASLIKRTSQKNLTLSGRQILNEIENVNISSSKLEIKSPYTLLK